MAVAISGRLKGKKGYSKQIKRVLDLEDLPGIGFEFDQRFL